MHTTVRDWGRAGSELEFERLENPTFNNDLAIETCASEEDEKDEKQRAIANWRGKVDLQRGSDKPPQSTYLRDEVIC